MAAKPRIKRLMWIVSIGGAVIIGGLISADSVGEFARIKSLDAFFAAFLGGEFFDAFVPLLVFTAFFSGSWFLGTWIIYFLVSWVVRILRRKQA